MRIHGDAPAIVAHQQPVAVLQSDLDLRGMPGDRLVHSVVEDLGREVVKRRLVRAADIHAGPAPDRL